MTAVRESQTLAIVPLRDMVVFPHMMAPFVVGRRPSVVALERALERPDKRLFLATQRDPKIDEPGAEDVYPLGVVARVVQHLQLASGNIKVMVEGLERARLVEVAPDPDCLLARVEVISVAVGEDPTLSRYMAQLTEFFKEYAKLSHHLSAEGVLASLQTDDPDQFADILAAHLNQPTTEKQRLLELVNPLDRLQRLNDLLDVEIEKLNIDRRLSSRVKKQMEKAQREYYLSEKIKAINEELGRNDTTEELAELKEQVEKSGMTQEAKEKALIEIRRLEGMPPVSAEAGVSRNYVDWLLAVPWSKASREIRDISRAEKVLDEDHHGLEKVKERILEFLAVRQLVRKTGGTILCFVGPPGVGKTSLARSIARATGRKFVRLSLGGVRDEAEIRGHRRTYIGAFPGQIIQMMRKAGTVNPVLLLDEVDKMAADFRGDPAGALLEVLDPEQNHTFHDHYLDVEYDLSKVLFICTANVTHPIPPALLDRMEKVELSGYTHREKLAIARGFLVPRQTERHGLKRYDLDFTDEGLMLLIERYTREAGVRNLEREIASICRKLARRVLKQRLKAKSASLEVTPAVVGELLGKPRYRTQRVEQEPETGAAVGLAWTQVGGELLTTEATLMRGKGNLTLTGQLGDVMQESARAALSFVRAKADELGIDPEVFGTTDVHIHVPEGAIPKDGPSAGITMASALVSAFTSVPVRIDVAMTGEITLRGRVFPVGGIKEKVLAAYRAGIREVIMPEENEKDLEEIPEDVRGEMSFVLVGHMDKVLASALVRDPESNVGAPSGDLESRVDSPPIAH
ncbi:MAG: endopeptidase La [Thermoanaerobaculales bacterium]|jgi:ATP-dependent Lon protease|nr:endopeptidase La [Thermoanaerobaculales bacterium]